MNDNVSQAAALLGSIGGKSGTGPSKARSSESMKEAAREQWISKRTPMPERFWRKVNIGSNDECWNWKRAVSDGYGHFCFNGTARPASQVAYEITHGPYNRSLYVCHKCDNRRCCNPNHLFLGTHNDNIQDAVRKCRFKRGADKPASKLTELQVIEIRKLYVPYSRKFSSGPLSKAFGVSRSVIAGIVNGKYWKHI